MSKETFKVNGQEFTTGNGALAAIRAYNRKHAEKFDRAKGHKIYIVKGDASWAK